jgi:basic membrane lipoprotein Med (substrate-binding protein (PBP1-ABC) superfamily)
MTLAAGVAACGSSSNSNKTTSTAAAAAAKSAATTQAATQAGPLTVGMALTGPKNDQGYNQSYYDGLLAAQKKDNLKIQVLDNVNSPQAYSTAMSTLAQSNKVVMGIGAEFATPAINLAAQYPKVTFLIANGSMSSKAPNVYAYFVRQGTPGYPAGKIAAQLSKTKHVGFIGGDDIPPTTGTRDAFFAGAKSVDPSIKTSAAITGDFYDAAKAKEAASAQIASGADVIFAFLDGDAVNAVVQAAQQAGKPIKIFQPIFSRCSEFKGVDVGFAYLSSTAQVEKMLGDYLGHTLPTQPKFYGLEDPSLQTLTLCPGFNTAANVKVVQDAINGINNGSIKLPAGV